MLLDVLLVLWIALAAVGGWNKNANARPIGSTPIPKIDNAPVERRGLLGSVVAILMLPLIGVVFLVIGAILAFPLLYWLVF